MKWLGSFLLWSAMVFGQTVAQPVVVNHFWNHGGWGLDEAVGADQSDRIDLPVFCDHPMSGECFDGAPWIVGLDGTQLKFTKTKDQQSTGTVTIWGTWTAHQVWTVLVPSTGLWHVRGEYFWVGTSVHYWGHIKVWEHVNL